MVGRPRFFLTVLRSSGRDRTPPLAARALPGPRFFAGGVTPPASWEVLTSANALCFRRVGGGNSACMKELGRRVPVRRERFQRYEEDSAARQKLKSSNLVRLLHVFGALFLGLGGGVRQQSLTASCSSRRKRPACSPSIWVWWNWNERGSRRLNHPLRTAPQKMKGLL